MVSSVSGNEGNVVSLMDRLVDMAFPEVSRMYAYWQDLRGTRPVPLRSEVDPRAIETCLEYAFILERIAPGLARFRLAGTHLNDLIGMEVRGMPISAIFNPEAREGLSEVVEAVFADPAIAELEIAAERGIGKAHMDGRLLLMPLKSDFGDVSRILGCLVTRGPIGRTPRRFKITQAKMTPVSAVVGTASEEISPVIETPAAPQPRPGALDGRPSMPRAGAADRGPIDPAPAPRAVDGFGEPPAGFKDAPRPDRRARPRLYIIRDNDPSE